MYLSPPEPIAGVEQPKHLGREAHFLRQDCLFSKFGSHGSGGEKVCDANGGYSAVVRLKAAAADALNMRLQCDLTVIDTKLDS